MDQGTTPTNNTAAPKAAASRPTAIDLFSKSFEAIKLNLPQHLLFYFAPMIVGAVLFMVLLGSFVGTSVLFGGGFSTGVTERGGEGLVGVSFVLSIIGFTIAIMAVGVVSYLANTYVGLQGAQGKKADIGTAIRATTKYIGGLIVFGLLASALVMAGFFLLIIPGAIIATYLWPRVMILPSVMIYENLGAMDAYRRSDKIVKAGGIWEVAFVFLAIGFLGIIPFVGSLASAVLGFIYSLAPTFRVLEASPRAASPAPVATTPPVEA